MKLHPMGGLCNRLQAILSYRAAFPGPFTVEWGDAYQCNGHFLDAFMPLDGVTFVDGPDLPMTHNGGPVILGPDYIADNHTCGHAPAGWVEGYRELVLRPELRAAMNAATETTVYPPGHVLASSGLAYDAIHVRRTDHLPLARSQGYVTADFVFSNFAAQTETFRMYIATDNRRTQLEMFTMLNRYGVRGLEYSPITDRANPNEHDRRNTPITHAAVDLFACAGAARFKGTALSSFTGTIELFRQMGIR